MSKTQQIPNHVDVEIDARGLNCPLPILKARQALIRMSSGEILKILATDPASAEDFPTFARVTKHDLLVSDTADEIWTYYLKVR